MAVIQFDPITHTYWHNNVRYLSATQIVDIFAPEFDADGEAQKFADKFGKTKDYWLTYWKEINHASLRRGDKKHDLMENIVRNRSMDVIHGKPLKVQNTEMFDETLSLSKFPDGIYTEEPICHHGYRIAGKPDKFAIETVLGHRYVHIDDYKTNKKLRTRSYRYFDGSYQMMKRPIQHLMDCEMIHYTLQLSEYMFMMEYHGYRPGKMRLIHFPHVPEMAPPGATDPAPTIHPIEYQRSDVMAMLSYLKRKQII